MLSRVRLWSAVTAIAIDALAISALSVPAAVGAQVAERSVVADLLDRITADINDLKYGEAIARGRLLTARAEGLSTAHRTRLHLLMAAAFFPEDRALQRRDSATRHLAAALRLSPDASYPAELRWRGLDSLAAATRANTPAVALRASERQAIGGPASPARLGFVATSELTVELRAVHRASGALAYADTVTAERGEFLLALHDDATLLMEPGVYDLVLSARPAGEGEAFTRSYHAEVEGMAPTLEEAPTLSESAFLPETARPDRARLRRTGLTAAIATVGLALIGHADPDLRRAFPVDPRAFVVGSTIAAGVLWTSRRDNERPLAANISANAAMRAAHARAVESVRERNADRLRAYAGVLVLVGDAP